MTLDDIATANRIAGEILGRTLDDLPPQTRRLLSLIDEFVSQEGKRLKLARADLPLHPARRAGAHRLDGLPGERPSGPAQQMEYVLAHRGERGQCFVYELLYDGQGQDGKPFLIGLLDVESLRTATVPRPARPKSSRG